MRKRGCGLGKPELQNGADNVTSARGGQAQEGDEERDDKRLEEADGLN
ncbi:MAG: hypothetical protein Q4P12_01375 [Bacteroidales bacterium]|nr:hypothetical protein [Bacteroidales bacterium]